MLSVNVLYVKFYKLATNDLRHLLHGILEPNCMKFHPFPPDRHQRAVEITTISQLGKALFSEFQTCYTREEKKLGHCICTVALWMGEEYLGKENAPPE